MNRMFVLKDLAYGAKVGGGTITGANEIGSLAEGAFAMLNEQGVLIPATLPASTLLDCKNVQLVHARNGGTQIVNLVPRTELRAINRANYRAAVKQVITIGGITSALALPFESEGEINIQVKDVSYSSNGTLAFKGVSTYKKSYMSNEDVVDDLVAKLNLDNELITAAKVADAGSAGYFGITVTTKKDNVQIAVSVSGMFEGASVATTTAMVHSVGSSDDILQMEKDFSTEEGNSNYIDYNTEHYPQVFSTVKGVNYDVISLHWEGRHSSPTSTKPVMLNTVCIGVPATASTLDADGIMALLAPVFTAVYSATTGAESAADDGTDTDGIAGN